MLDIKDTQCGFKLYKGNIAKKIFKRLTENGYIHDVEILILLQRSKISVKEIQLKPKIDTHDFNIKLNKSRKFLDSGDKVKFTMRFRGREAEHPEFGQKVLDNYIEKLSDIAMVESTSSPDGKSLTMVLAPTGGKK